MSGAAKQQRDRERQRAELDEAAERALQAMREEAARAAFDWQANPEAIAASVVAAVGQVKAAEIAAAINRKLTHARVGQCDLQLQRALADGRRR